MIDEETKDIKNAIQVLKRKFFQSRNINKKLRLQLKELLIVNNRLEKEIKKYKQEEADKLSGFLSIGAIHVPKIDRTYK